MGEAEKNHDAYMAGLRWRALSKKERRDVVKQVRELALFAGAMAGVAQDPDREHRLATNLDLAAEYLRLSEPHPPRRLKHPRAHQKWCPAFQGGSCACANGAPRPLAAKPAPARRKGR